MSKYNSEKIVIDGITFDSKMEGMYYEYLKKLKSKGQIENFELQPKFVLIPSFKYKGKTERATTYTLDFLIYHLDGREEYIDVKGNETPQGIIKFKMLKHQHPEMDFKWIARSLKYGNDGWIEYGELKKVRSKNRKLKKAKEDQ